MASQRQAWANGTSVRSETESMRRFDVDSAESSDASNHHAHCRESLSSIIEADIIPRLMLVHRRADDDFPDTGSHLSPSADDVAQVMNFVVVGEIESAREKIRFMRVLGLSLEALFLELLAPVARKLGVAWETDELSFVDVTIGLTGLQQLLREFAPGALPVNQKSAGKALLVPAPGDQHTFGLLLLIEFFRRSGWDVSGGAHMDVGDLCNAVRTESFSVVGFSLSRESLLDQLRSAIHAVRGASKNRGLSIMVGGRVFVERPELADKVGADGTAPTAKHAVLEAKSLSGSAG